MTCRNLILPFAALEAPCDPFRFPRLILHVVSLDMDSLPPSPTLVPCRVALLRQLSRGGTCGNRLGGREFGCRGSSAGAHVWVRAGCRGSFTCNGLTLNCGGDKRVCSCNLPSPPPPSPPRRLSKRHVALQYKLADYLTRVYPDDMIPRDYRFMLARQDGTPAPGEN